MSRNLNYFEHFLVFAFAVSGCISVSAFASIVDIPVGIASFAVGLIFFFNNFTSTIRKKGKNIIK